jgi:type II secretory pathway component GspD/PulD (secretin)
MKALIQTTLSLSCAWGVLQATAAQPTPKAEQELRAPPVEQNSTAPGAATQGTPADKPANAEVASTKENTEAKPAALPALGPDQLRLNFRNAPLESVLSYLSDAAGFIIAPDKGVSLSGKVTMWSNQPVSKDEALELLGSALDQNGYAFAQAGRTLKIYTKSDAKTRPLPVKSGSDPQNIPNNDQVVTQILPVKFINAVQLSRDLQQLKPDSATWQANEGGNSLIVTDTQTNIRHLAEIIRALDTAISSVSSVRVFKLQFADAKAVASVIKDLFTTQDSSRNSGNNAAASRLMNTLRGGGGNRGGFGGGFPGAGGFAGAGGNQGGSDSSAGGGRAPTPRVVAVSEDRSNSVVINAPDDQMPIIEDMIKQLDTSVEDITELRVFHLKFADAQETADLLTSLFSDSNSSSSNQGFRSGLLQFGGRMGGGNRGSSSTSASDSARLQKQTKVVAVADLRTSSVIVSAARDLIQQIKGMIDDLDADPSRKQGVYVFDFQNTDPSQAVTILQTLFPNQQSGSSYNNRNQNQAGVGNQLNNRATQNQNGTGRSGSGRSSTGLSSGLSTFGQ